MSATGESAPVKGVQPVAPFPPGFGPGYPGMGVPHRSATRFILPILAVLLAIALVATGAFAFVLNNDLSNTRNALATEQAARRAAVNGLTACISSMKADEASLQALNTQILTAENSIMTGSVSTAISAYESAVQTALTDFNEGSLAMNHAALINDTDAFNAAVLVLIRAENEMNQAATLKASLDTALASYSSSVQQANSSAASLAAHMATTTSTCNAAVEAAALPSGSPAASPAASPAHSSSSH